MIRVGLTSLLVALLVANARATSPVIDVINGDETPGFFTFIPNNVGWVYEPSLDYELDGIFSTFSAIPNPAPPTRDVVLTFYDAPPADGGNLLRTGTFSAGAAGGDLGVKFDPIAVTAGEDYFIGYEEIAGLGLNIVDFEVSLPPPDFLPNPDVQFQSGWYTDPNFSTFNSLEDSPGFSAPILRFTGVPEPSGLILLAPYLLALRSRKR